MSPSPRTMAAVVVGALLLLWPAFVNVYPIVFSDTGGLLEMGFAPNMGWDKPFVYGPFLAVASLRLTLWLPVALQALAVSYALLLVQRAFAPAPASRHVLVCLAAALLTAAPWFASTLMPDAFTPVTILGLIALVGPKRLPLAHRVPLVILTALAIAAHLSHLVSATALVLALALLRRAIPRAALLSLLAALALLLATNWIGRGRPAISPYGAVFALARLVADGPARDYLDRVCPDADLILCAWRPALTSDSDQFLWDPASPFWADPAPLPTFAAQAAQIVRGTIAAYPLRVFRDAYRNTARQLVTASVGDTLSADYLDDTVRPRIERWLPATERAQFDRGLQRRGLLAQIALPFTRVADPVLALLLLSALAILLRALATSSPSTRADITALLLIALSANAFSTGALSTVHDRYQARIAWLLLLPLTLHFKKTPCSAPSPSRRGPG